MSRNNRIKSTDKLNSFSEDILAEGKDMIDLFHCKCGGTNQEQRSWESCVCPRVWALPGIGRVLISKRGVSMKGRRSPIGVPIGQMFWWHDPQACPPFVKQTEYVDDGLHPILAPRVFDIWRERRRLWKSIQNRGIHMKVYRGSRSGYDRQIVVIEGAVSADLSPAPSQDVVNHSPDGFNWGYSGSGPAQLALGLLLDVTENREIASKYYQLFKADAVAQFGESWEITEVAIRRWLVDNGVNI